MFSYRSLQSKYEYANTENVTLYTIAYILALNDSNQSKKLQFYYQFYLDAFHKISIQKV